MASKPLVALRNCVLGLIGLAVLICLADWYATMRALPGVRIAIRLQPAAIPADGKSRSQIVVRVTEGGKPRAHDYLEATSLDSGYLVPLLALTNQQGEAHFTYASLPASPYDTATSARILFTDTSLGRIIEVDKSITISVHLIQPKSG